MTIDKTSVKILKYLKDKKEPVEESVIISECGPNASDSLEYLVKNGYIKEGFKFGGTRPDPITGRATTFNVPNGKYKIVSTGRAYLSQRFWNGIDKWVTRISAIIGLITGVLSLVLHFLAQ